MTINNEKTYQILKSTGLKDPYFFDIQFISKETIKVIVLKSDGSKEDLEYEKDYRVTDSKSIEFLKEYPKKEDTILIFRQSDITQDVEFPPNIHFRESNIELMGDKIVLQTQELKSEIKRSTKIPIELENINTELPYPKPSRVIAWNHDGTKLINAETDIPKPRKGKDGDLIRIKNNGYELFDLGLKESKCGNKNQIVRVSDDKKSYEFDNLPKFPLGTLCDLGKIPVMKGENSFEYVKLGIPIPSSGNKDQILRISKDKTSYEFDNLPQFPIAKVTDVNKVPAIKSGNQFEYVLLPQPNTPNPSSGQPSQVLRVAQDKKLYEFDNLPKFPLSSATNIGKIPVMKTGDEFEYVKLPNYVPNPKTAKSDSLIRVNNNAYELFNLGIKEPKDGNSNQILRISKDKTSYEFDNLPQFPKANTEDKGKVAVIKTENEFEYVNLPKGSATNTPDPSTGNSNQILRASKDKTSYQFSDLPKFSKISTNDIGKIPIIKTENEFDYIELPKGGPSFGSISNKELVATLNFEIKNAKIGYDPSNELYYQPQPTGEIPHIFKGAEYYLKFIHDALNLKKEHVTAKLHLRSIEKSRISPMKKSRLWWLCQNRIFFTAQILDVPKKYEDLLFKFELEMQICQSHRKNKSKLYTSKTIAANSTGTLMVQTSFSQGAFIFDLKATVSVYRPIQINLGIKEPKDGSPNQILRVSKDKKSYEFDDLPKLPKSTTEDIGKVPVLKKEDEFEYVKLPKGGSDGKELLEVRKREIRNVRAGKGNIGRDLIRTAPGIFIGASYNMYPTSKNEKADPDQLAKYIGTTFYLTSISIIRNEAGVQRSSIVHCAIQTSNTFNEDKVKDFFVEFECKVTFHPFDGKSSKIIGSNTSDSMIVIAYNPDHKEISDDTTFNLEIKASNI